MTQAALRLARWANAFAETSFSADIAARLRMVLLDTIACALAADRRNVLQTVGAWGGTPACSIVGSSLRTSTPLATFANGALIRALDYNDIYFGPAQIGHPSDNIAAALAVAEAADRSGLALLQAIRLGYEIYGRLQDMTDPANHWDHVSASGITCAVMSGWLLRLPAEQLAHAISLAALHSATLGQARRGTVSTAKSLANAIVAQTAVQMTLLAEAGMTGPPAALEGAGGFGKLVLGADTLEALWTDAGEERILSVGLKAYPCFVLGQGPVQAAIGIAKSVEVNAIERITLSLADSAPARMRLADPGGSSPSSREAADHSLQYLVALALLERRVTVEQFGRQRWLDDDVRGLMQSIELRIDPAMAAFAFRMEIAERGGRVHALASASGPGHPANTLSPQQIEAKFRDCSTGFLSEDAQERVIRMVGDIDRLASVRTLLAQLT